MNTTFRQGMKLNQMSADQLNILQAGAQRVNPTNNQAANMQRHLAANNVVIGYNATGKTLRPGSVVGIEDLYVTADQNPNWMYQQIFKLVVLDRDPPPVDEDDNETGVTYPKQHVAVVRSVADDGETAQVIIYGRAVITVDIQDESHNYCNCVLSGGDM